VVLHYFDMDGRSVSWGDEARLLAVTREQLSSTPLVIGAAAGAAKAPGIIGAARAKLINALATDEGTAEAVLELLG
jgi:DNA-binding transcriptional regulator LsrR (DeoR family)